MEDLDLFFMKTLTLDGNDVLNYKHRSVLLDLVAPLAVMLLGSGLVLGFTKANSLFRLANLPVNLALANVIIQTSSVHLRKNHGRLLGSFAAGMMFHWVDIALVSRWAFEDSDRRNCTLSAKTDATTTRNEPLHDKKSLWLQRAQWGLSSLFESRRLNTPSEAKNVLPLPPHVSDSRLIFILYAFVRLTVCYLIVDLLSPCPSPSAETCADLYALWKIPVFTRLLRRNPIHPSELTFRLIFTLSFWLLTYSMMTVVMTVASIVAVGSGIHGPRDWKPFFQHMSYAYSIRGFWGRFWHQAFRYPFGNLAGCFVETVFNPWTTNRAAKPWPWVIKYAKLFGTFALSGLFHVMGDLGAKGNVQQHQTMQFFVTQAAGILFEDQVCVLYKALRGRSKLSGPKYWERLLGYIWCAMFLVWTTPQWMYPSLVTNTADTKPFLPFSVKGLFLQHSC